MGDAIGEEVSSFSQVKVLIDIFLYKTFNSKYDLYTYLL